MMIFIRLYSRKLLLISLVSGRHSSLIGLARRVRPVHELFGMIIHLQSVLQAKEFPGETNPQFNPHEKTPTNCSFTEAAAASPNRFIRVKLFVLLPAYLHLTV